MKNQEILKNLKEKLEPHYNSILTEIYNNRILKVKSLVGFFPQVGTNYGNGNKILVVGRAVNGWRIRSEFNLKNYKTEKKDYFNCFYNASNDEKMLEWVDDRYGIINKNKHSKINKNKEDRYNTKRSAFWRTTRRLSLKILDKADGNFSFNDIAWSNLYKIAYKSGKNPGKELKAATFSDCKEILKEEINCLQPTTIIFLTDYIDWFNAFEEMLKGFKYFNIKKVKKTYSYHVGTFSIENKIVHFVVAPRPESIKESILADEMEYLINVDKNN